EGRLRRSLLRGYVEVVNSRVQCRAHNCAGGVQEGSRTIDDGLDARQCANERRSVFDGGDSGLDAANLVGECNQFRAVSAEQYRRPSAPADLLHDEAACMSCCSEDSDLCACHDIRRYGRTISIAVEIFRLSRLSWHDSSAFAWLPRCFREPS